jgi:hypothetical protein
VQGLLLNARLVQGIFDDRNTNTLSWWSYPDTGKWDPERNTREFMAAMPEWRRHGLLAFTINLQGGSPRGYVGAQPWHNSAFEGDGSLRSDYTARLERKPKHEQLCGRFPVSAREPGDKHSAEARLLYGVERHNRWPGEMTDQSQRTCNSAGPFGPRSPQCAMQPGGPRPLKY